MAIAAQPVRHLAPTLPSDTELVLRACDGDRWAKEAIFRRYVEPVFRLVRRLHNGDDIEDIVQDTFADALLHLHTLREPSALRSWLFGIAVRRVRRAQRKRSVFRRFFVDEGEGCLEREASPQCTAEQRAELAWVDDILRRGSADERIAWVLRRVEGERLLAIAEITGTSVATVKTTRCGRRQTYCEGSSPMTMPPDHDSGADPRDRIAGWLRDGGESEERIHAVWRGTEERLLRDESNADASEIVRPMGFRLAVAAVVLLAAGGTTLWVLGSHSVEERPEQVSLTLDDGGAVVAEEAARESRTLVYSDGSQVELAPGARLVPVLNSAEAFTTELIRGRAHFDVRPGGPRAWRIRTSHHEVWVLGTAFVVDAGAGRTSADDEGRAEVSVERGRVEVLERATGERRTLRAGDRWQAPVQVVTSPPVELAPPPSDERPHAANEGIRDSSERAGAPDRPRIDWRALARAGAYEEAYAALPSRTPRSIGDQLLAVDVARRSGHVDEAVALLGTVLDHHQEGEEVALAAITLGRLERRRGRWSQAELAYERARQLGVPRAFADEVCAERALLRVRLGRTAEGRRLAAECLGVNPSSAYGASLRPLVRGE